MTNAQLAVDLRVVVALVFLVAGLLKSTERTQAQSSLLEAVGIEAEGARRLLVRALPVLEVGLGIWLLSGWRPIAAVGASTGLLVAFALVLSRALLTGHDGSCGCFGSKSGRVGVSNLVFDLFLLLISSAAILLHISSGTEAAISIMHVGPTDLLLIGLAGLWLFAVHAMMREIEEVARMLTVVGRGWYWPGSAAG
jgi:hypothetical protein